VLHAPDGDRRVPIDRAAPMRPVPLGPGQGALLMIGSPAASGPPRDVVRRVRVSAGGDDVVALRDAYVPLTCGDPGITYFEAVPGVVS
jgi:hypothetical protein